MDARHGRAQGAQGGLRVVLGFVEEAAHLRHPLGHDAVADRRRVQQQARLPHVHGGGDEELLGAVVQVAFDAAALDLEGGDDLAAGLRELGHFLRGHARQIPVSAKQCGADHPPGPPQEEAAQSYSRRDDADRDSRVGVHRQGPSQDPQRGVEGERAHGREASDPQPRHEVRARQTPQDGALGLAQVARARGIGIHPSILGAASPSPAPG